jgi:YVTN family beta-propeller protein
MFLLTVVAVTARAEFGIVTRYPIGGDTSRWDYITIDPATRYLYAAHFTKFEVLDADTGKKIGELAPANRAHGVVIIPEVGRGFATSGNDGEVIVFDPKTLKISSRFKTGGKNPDAIQYDAEDTKKIYVCNADSGFVSVIDPAAAKVVGQVTITDHGKIEQIGFDGRGRAFVANEEKSVVHVFDTRSLKHLADWPVAPGEGGTGLLVDQKNHRVFVCCANEKLVVLDSDTGKVVATPTTGEDADGAAFDPSRGLIFVSNADKTLTVLHQDSPDQYSLVQQVATSDGAKQIGLDAKTGRLFLPTGKFGPKPAPTDKVPNPRLPWSRGLSKSWLWLRSSAVSSRRARFAGRFVLALPPRVKNLPDPFLCFVC